MLKKKDVIRRKQVMHTLTERRIMSEISVCIVCCVLFVVYCLVCACFQLHCVCFFNCELIFLPNLKNIYLQQLIVLFVKQHPFILRLRYAFHTKDHLYMVTDFCGGGELFFHLKRLRRFSEGMVRFYAAQISVALAHLHAHNIVYRDLKPENVKKYFP